MTACLCMSVICISKDMYNVPDCALFTESESFCGYHLMQLSALFPTNPTLLVASFLGSKAWLALPYCSTTTRTEYLCIDIVTRLCAA